MFRFDEVDVAILFSVSVFSVDLGVHPEFWVSAIAAGYGGEVDAEGVAGACRDR